MMKKRLIASAASLALLFTTAFCGLSTPVHAAEVDTNTLPKIIEDDTEFIRDSETGHISIVNDDNGYVSSNAGRITPNSASLQQVYGNIPAIKSNFPNTRNQGAYGTCWAHAATAAAEFDMVKNHGFAKSNADFSELQLAYLHYNTGKVLPGLDGDKIYIPSNAPKNYLDVGGNIYYSMQTLAQWKCYSYESNLPYSNVTSNKSYNPYNAIGSWSNNTYHNAAQLKNLRMLNIKKDPNAVKTAIMTTGPVYISYNSDNDYYTTNGYTYYYNPNKVGTNHDVVIVGWDDTVSRTKFPASARPATDGAWLVRNSWTTSSGDYGSANSYFYMSYADATLAETAYSLDFEGYWVDDNIYQYDGVTTHSSVSANGVANVFTANTNMDRSSEKLDSVMVSFMYAENVPYKVEVYKNLTSTLPRSGKLAATVTGKTTSKGIYTIDLNDDIFLFPGERYSIVITTSDGSYKPFDIESSQKVTYGASIPWFTTEAHADEGESYVYSNGAWSDATFYGTGFGNVCVKSITSDSNICKYNISYQLNGGTNHSDNPTTFTSNQTGYYSLQEPTRTGYHFLGWFSDSSLQNKVTTVNYNNKANQTFYAGWCSDSNPLNLDVYSTADTDSDGSYAMICSGCGLMKSYNTSYMISSVSLSSKSFNYDGKAKSPVPVIKNRNGDVLQPDIDYTYVYDQSSRIKTGRYSVTIFFINKYSGTSTLYFDILQSGPAKAGATLYGFNDIKVTWSKVSGASGYKVYYKKSTATTYKNYKTTKNLYLKFVDLAGNTKYNFKIVPTFKDGRTAGSKIVSATTLKKLNQPTIKKIANGRVSLNWQCISAASGYQVWWSTSKNGTYKRLCEFSKDYIGVSFNVGKNKQYWYKTRAYRIVNGKRIYAPYSTPKAFTLR